MSDTYNENEIVRCKHLNELARQLKIKLDGGTAERNITWIVLYTSPLQVISDISQPVHAPISAIRDVQRDFQIQLKVPVVDLDDTSRVIVKNFFSSDSTLTAPSIVVYDYQLFPNSNANGVYNLIFKINKLAQTLQFDVFIPSNEKYLETNQHVTVVIEEE